MKLLKNFHFPVLLSIFWATNLVAAEENNDSSKKSEQNIGGVSFSLGLGFESYKEPYINETVLRGSGDERRVIVTDSFDYNTSIWLNTNYVFDGYNLSGWVHPGIYAGVRIGGSEDSTAFNAFSIGALVALKRRPNKSNVFNSINIGIGPVWHRTQVLAPGIYEGEALPEYYSDNIQLQKKDEVSWMLMLSAGFE